MIFPATSIRPQNIATQTQAYFFWMRESFGINGHNERSNLALNKRRPIRKFQFLSNIDLYRVKSLDRAWNYSSRVGPSRWEESPTLPPECAQAGKHNPHLNTFFFSKEKYIILFLQFFDTVPAKLMIWYI